MLEAVAIMTKHIYYFLVDPPQPYYSFTLWIKALKSILDNV